MAVEILPPSPSWYLSSASSLSEDGIFAFATRSAIFLLDISVCPPTFHGVLSSHTERVTAVSCSRSAGETHLCATAGDDGVIKIWDLKTKLVLDEKKCQEGKITSIDWSRASKDVVVAGDDKGVLIHWNIASGDVKLLKPERGHIYSLACNPHNAGVVAVGYKDGKIMILDALSKKDQVIHSLKGHNDEVQSLAWAPYLGEDAFLKTKPDEDDPSSQEACLLMSGSKDKTIRVWSTGQGKLLKVINLPPRGGGQRPRDRGDEAGMRARVWVSLNWSKERPHQLISSSHGGDVLLWDLSKPSQLRWEILGSDGDPTHLRSVFSIVGRSHDPERIITTSLDRQVICWNLTTMTSEWNLPTLGGFVYCTAASPLDPTRLALGVGDNTIRVWNTAARGKAFDTSTLWQGLKSKVTVVSWHPLRENSLGYATDDGRVGIFNVSSFGKPPQVSWTFHKKTVYSLSWGPPCPAAEGSHSQSHYLYSCGGEGVIYQHNPAKLDQEASNVNSLIKQTNNLQHLLPQRSDISWRADGRAVAIGNGDGSVEVYAPPNLLLLCTIHVQNKIINCLQWYPDCELIDQSETRYVRSNQSGDSADQKVESSGVEQEADGDNALPDNVSSQETAGGIDQSNGRMDSVEMPAATNQSEKRYWLASGSNDHELEIYDLTGILSSDSPQPLTIPITSSYRTLTGHTGRVTCIAWSPHGDGRLVTTSYDYSAEVWDVLKGEPLANFRGHSGRVYSCIWSCSDPDIILTGGEDFCLMRWKISEAKHIKPPKSTRKPHSGNKKSGRKGKKSWQPDPRDAPRSDVKDAVPMATGKSVGTNENRAEVHEKKNGAEPNSQLVKDTIQSTVPPEGAAALQPQGTGDGESRLLLEKKRDLLAEVEKIEARMKREKSGEEEEEEKKGTVEDVEVTEERDSAGKKNEALQAILERLAPAPDQAPEASLKDVSKEKGTLKDLTGPSKKKGRSKKDKSLFPMSGGKDNRGKTFVQQDCVDLAMIKQGQVPDWSAPVVDPDQTSLHLGLYGDRRQAMQLINEEASQHAKSGNYDQHNQLHLWKGNILHPLREAIKRGQLTDSLVAMAPLAGHDVWLKTCEAFAKQLESHDYVLRAVHYYLLSQQVYRAIELLKKHSLFRDAIALAHARLLPSDPVISDLYVTWAGQLEAINSYEPAARCYLAVNQTLNAVKILTRKGDTQALGTALRVAVLSNFVEDSLVVSIATRYLNSCLLTGQWKQAVEIFSLHKNFGVYAQLVLVYELLVWCLVHQNYVVPQSDIDFTDAHLKNTPNIQWKEVAGSWPIPTQNGAPLLQGLFQRAGLSCDQSPDQHRLGDMLPSDDPSPDINKVLRSVAHHLLQGHWGQRSEYNDELGTHMVQALKLCHSSGYPDIAIALLQLTLPTGDLLEDVGARMTAEKREEIIPRAASLRAYSKLTTLHHMKASLRSNKTSLESQTSTAGQDDLQDGGRKSESADGQGDLLQASETENKEGAIRDGHRESEDQDSNLTFNPRTEGYLFHWDSSQRSKSWPVQPSSVQIKSMIIRLGISVQENATVPDTESGQSLKEANSDSIYQSEDEFVAGILSLVTSGAEPEVELVNGNHVAEENINTEDKVGLQETPSTHLPHCSSYKNGISDESCDNGQVKQGAAEEPLGGTVPATDDPRERELAVIQAVLLQDEYAVPCIACSKLSRAVPSGEPCQRELCLDMRNVAHLELIKRIATSNFDDLRKMASRQDVSEVFQLVKKKMLKQVENFPDPLSSCAALLDTVTALQAASKASQSQDSVTDQLLRQLSDWSTHYADIPRDGQ